MVSDGTDVVAQRPPLAVLGGTVIGHGTVVEDGAVYIVDGIIRSVGRRDEIEPEIPGISRVIDASGSTIAPGFIDAHAHPLSFGLSLLPNSSVRHPEVASIRELVDAVRRMVEAAEPGEWVRGRGFDYAKYPENRMPTRWDIDQVSPRNPVALVHSSGHFALVNSAALAAAGIDESVNDPTAGAFVRDDQGRVTGMLLDAAMEMVLPRTVDASGHGPNHNTFPASADDLLLHLESGLGAFAAAGVTTVVDAQTMARDMPIYLEAQRRGRMSIRVICMYLSNHLEALKALGLNGMLGDRRLALGPLKLYSDGALTGCTALFSDPYEGDGEADGHAYWTPAELRALVRDAHEFGLQVGIHAQGDLAIGMSLDAFDEALRGSPRDDHRHRIEHCGAPSTDHISLMKRLGAIPVAQPGFLYQFGDSFLKNLGVERAQRLTPLHSLIEAGIPVALSSDAPVSSHEPLRNIQSAMSRRSMGGADMGKGEEISVTQAIEAYTWNSARSVFRESWCGALRPGYVGDIAVLGADIRNVSRTDIADVEVRCTIVDGEPVFGEGLS